MKQFAVKWVMALLLLCICVFATYVFTRTPSHTREWEPGQEMLPRIVFSDEDTFTIEQLRDFVWTGAYEAQRRYRTDTFHLSDIERLDVVISHFSSFEGLAHIFLSFGFRDGRHVSISFETRREVGEEFSPLLGLFRTYEIIYVVGTDRDVIGVRTGYRNERVYLYRTVATPEEAQRLFVRLAKKINEIYDQPRFYNTLTHNCINEIAREVEDEFSLSFPFTYKMLLPGYMDEVLYNLGLLDTSVPFEELKSRSRIKNDEVDERDPLYEMQIRAQEFPAVHTLYEIPHIMRYNTSITHNT